MLWCNPYIVPEVAEREGARGDGEASKSAVSFTHIPSAYLVAVWHL